MTTATMNRRRTPGRPGRIVRAFRLRRTMASSGHEAGFCQLNNLTARMLLWAMRHADRQQS